MLPGRFIRMRWLPVLVLFLAAVSSSAQTGGGNGGADEQPPKLMDIRAGDGLMFGVGEESGSQYFDVPITRLAEDGVLIKLGYTQRGGELTFDLHHRAGLSPDFGLPAEIMTVVDVITGSSSRIGSFTLLSTVSEDATSEEQLIRISDAEVDRYVTPLGSKSVTLKTDPGPQSISIVGRELTITRDGFVTRVDTPGTRIAMVSNIRFEETRPGETLTFGNEP
jgi:hypothetical protein